MAKRKAKKKYYVMKKGNKISVFTGRSPRQAALKAASRGIKDIRLRERGRRNKDRTYTIHIFKGDYKTVDAPANRPSWLPAKIKKAIVSKVGVEKVKKI
jgi:hypothetical protein